jgi:hypothetical protein
MEKFIIDEIVNDYIIKGLKAFSIIYNKNNTLVMEHNKYPEYLLKLSNKDFESSKIQLDILSSIPTENKNICRIHHTQIFEENGNARTMEIIDKLNGITKKEYSKIDIERVIQATKMLNMDLNKYANKYYENLPSIGILLPTIIQNSSNKTLKSLAKIIQNDSAYESFIDTENQNIIVADLVYENILFANNAINFIDLDPLILGPKELQFSILLTSNILIQSNQFKNLSMDLIKNYAHLWGIERINREVLISLSIFPLLILAMKEVDVDSLPENQDSIYYKLKIILLFIIGELNNG